jgi:hypothetical protein
MVGTQENGNSGAVYDIDAFSSGLVATSNHRPEEPTSDSVQYTYAWVNTNMLGTVPENVPKRSKICPA